MYLCPNNWIKGLFKGFQRWKRIYLPFWGIVVFQVDGAELDAGNLYGAGFQGDDSLFVLGNLHLGKAHADDAQDTGGSNTEVDAVLAAKGASVCYTDNDLASVLDVLYPESCTKGESTMGTSKAIPMEAFTVGSKPTVQVVPRSFSGEDLR